MRSLLGRSGFAICEDSEIPQVLGSSGLWLPPPDCSQEKYREYVLFGKGAAGGVQSEASSFPNGSASVLPARSNHDRAGPSSSPPGLGSEWLRRITYMVMFVKMFFQAIQETDRDISLYVTS